MIQLVNLGKHFQGRILFEKCNWQVRDGDRIGLTGPNGSGKTTLLRILAGQVQADEGQMVVPRGTTIGYLPQDGLHIAGRPLFEEMRHAFEDLMALQKEEGELEHQIATVHHDDPSYLDLIARHHEVQTAFREGGGYSIDGQIGLVLVGLGFQRSDFEKECGTFSGGWQMRIALAKLLLVKPGLLLLDEPTNHLDIEARTWLQEFLRSYPFSVILVSHDRYFLDAVVNRITEVTQQGLLDFTGGYSRFIVQKEEHFARIASHNLRLKEEIARLLDLAARFGAKATKAAAAQSWRKQAEKLKEELLPEPAHRDTIHFRFPPAPHSGKTTLTLEHISKSYGSKSIFQNVDLIVQRGERIALVGVNGAGKSTMMRILAGKEPHQGNVVFGHEVVPSYFAQDQAHVLNPEKSVLEEVMADASMQIVPRIRSLLGSFLFSGDTVEKPIKVLSGGERNRVALVKLLLRPANLLLLDEPTNHLDMDSKDILLEALQQFEGTIVFVSHDRYFLEQLATKVVQIEGGRVDTYLGRYDEYLWKKAQEAGMPAGAGVATVGASTATTTAVAPEAAGDKAARIAEREAKKSAEKSKRAGEKRIGELEEKIASIEEELKAIEVRLADNATYANAAEAAELSRTHAAKKTDVEKLYAEWEEVHALLAT